MQSKAKKSIINLLPILLWIALLAFFVIRAIDKGASLPMTLLWCAVGAAACYVVALLAHELGHFVFARLLGMRAEYVNFGLFSVDFRKKRIKLFTFIGNNAGESCFLPEKEVKSEHIRGLAASGINASLIILAIYVAVLFIVRDVYAFVFFAGGVCAAGYLLTVNLFPLDKTSDGALLFGSKKHISSLALCADLSRRIQADEVSEEPVTIMNSSEPSEIFFHYLFTAIKQGKDRALKVIEALDINGDYTDEEYEMIFPELLFAACTKGELSDGMKNAADNFFLLNSESPAILRSHYAYRKFVGDDKWADAIAVSYRRVLSSAPSFIVAAEKALTQEVGL